MILTEVIPVLCLDLANELLYNVRCGACLLLIFLYYRLLSL